jgi:hypothetical protein
MMMAVDEDAARRLVCAVQRGDTVTSGAPSAEDRSCEIAIPDSEVGADTAASAVTSIEPRDEFGRRRRR